MSKNKLNDSDDDDDDDEEDDDYCPTAKDHEASESSAEEESHEDIKEPDNDSNVKPYDESKTDELWKSLTSDSKTTAAAVKPAVETPKPAPVITKIFEFAGEKISVPVPSTTSSSLSSKRPAGGSSSSSSVLDRLGIGKKQKLSTLEKSRLDWQAHKDSEALTEDLESHRRGKDSYVEKKAFLQRSETREHDHYLTHLKKK